MRPQKASYIINKVMEQWYSYDDEKKFVYPKNFLSALDKMIEKEIIYMKKSDSREEMENYGKYIDSYPDYKMSLTPENYLSWRSEMFYISDRWSAFHRVSWLKYGIENNLFA